MRKNLKPENITTTRFEKVSIEIFTRDWIKFFPEDEDNPEYIQAIYNNIKLPTRKTNKSAGYDFFIPMDVIFCSEGEMVIPTGIKCTKIPDNKILLFHTQNNNSISNFDIVNITGIIDANNSDTKEEYHIIIKMTNNSEFEFNIDQGKPFCQGVIQNYYITNDDKHIVTN